MGCAIMYSSKTKGDYSMERKVVEPMEMIQSMIGRIRADIEEMNLNPSFQNYANLRADCDFYSDIYKDEFGYRPRNQIAALLKNLSDRAREIGIKFNNLPWEEQDKYNPY